MSAVEGDTKKPHASELADKCAGIARCLSYNEDPQQSETKHTLRECAYFINSQVCKLQGKRLSNALGKARVATWRERAAKWLLQGKLEIRP